jgi:hypothetical protein
MFEKHVARSEHCTHALVTDGSTISTSVSVVRMHRISHWPESARELYRPSDRLFSAKLVPTFPVRGCHVVSVTDPYGHNLGFLDRSRYFFFQVAPQLYSRDSVDPVPDPLLLRKSGSAGNRTRTSGSVAKSSDHQTTEAVHLMLLDSSIKNWRNRLMGSSMYIQAYPYHTIFEQHIFPFISISKRNIHNFNLSLIPYWIQSQFQLIKYYWGGYSKEDVAEGTCRTYRKSGDACRILVAKPKWEKPLGISSRWSDDNNKIGFKKYDIRASLWSGFILIPIGGISGVLPTLVFNKENVFRVQQWQTVCWSPNTLWALHIGFGYVARIVLI